MSDRVTETLTQIFKSIGILEISIDISEVAGQHIYTITGPESAIKTMGMHQDMAHSVEFLVKRILERIDPNTEQHFVIDFDGKRVAHIKELETRAKMMAERAKSFQYDVELAPMSAYDRLIIHTTLQGIAHIKTESQGEGRSRRIVIKYTG